LIVLSHNNLNRKYDGINRGDIFGENIRYKVVLETGEY
jgi:hypothetical protein